MPNHITNRITCDSQEIFEKIKTCLVNLHGEVDFEMLIPFPPEFADIHCGWVTIDGVECTVWRVEDGKSVRIPDKELDGLMDKYGSLNGLDWARVNWGTKWNAYDYSISDSEIVFDTAWSCPGPVVKSLFSRVSSGWTWKYADEDIGSNCGIICALDGELSTCDKSGDIKFAVETKGWDYDEYLREREEWKQEMAEYEKSISS